MFLVWHVQIMPRMVRTLVLFKLLLIVCICNIFKLYSDVKLGNYVKFNNFILRI